MEGTKTDSALMRATSSEDEMNIQHLPNLQLPMSFWKTNLLGKWQIIWGLHRYNLASLFLGTAEGDNYLCISNKSCYKTRKLSL